MAKKAEVLPDADVNPKRGTVPPYKPDELKEIKYLKTRRDELMQARRKVGRNRLNIERIWDAADRAYEPHRIKRRSKRFLVEDENLGFRSVSVEIGKDNWQSRNSQPNVYIQIQTALSILVDSNPDALFMPGSSKYEATTVLIKNLYKNNWHVARSKQQLKMMIFNGAKYGVMFGRTYPLRKAKIVRDLVSFDPLHPDKAEYKEREDVEFDDIYRESLNPRDVWPDNNAVPADPMSWGDVVYYKRYSYDKANKEFGNYPYFEYVATHTGARENPNNEDTEQEREHPYTEGVDAYFYESKDHDWYAVELNGVWVISREPLPTMHKKLSVYGGPWTLRDDRTIYGLGVYETLRDDQEMLDRIRNMTMDQLVLSIYKMFFYSGSNSDDSTGKITLAPGVGRRIPDAEKMKWSDIPGPGQEAWDALKYMEEGLEKDTGISRTLQGEVVGKTAFELQAIRESSLRRMKLPLDNIAECMLEPDAYLTISLMEQKYSVPDVIRLTSDEQIKNYLDEIQSDKELYETEIDEAGNVLFNAKLPPEMRLSLEEDGQGNLTESDKAKFFRIKPSALHWEGMIRVQPQSIITPSKELNKQMDMELFNLLMPLFSGSLAAFQADQQVNAASGGANYGDGARRYIDTVIKPVKNMLKQYEKDTSDWLPNWWLAPLPGEVPQDEAPLPPPQLDANGQPIASPQPPQAPPGAPQGGNSLFVAPGAAGIAQAIQPNAAPQPQPTGNQPSVTGAAIGQPVTKSLVGRAVAAASPIK